MRAAPNPSPAGTPSAGARTGSARGGSAALAVDGVSSAGPTQPGQRDPPQMPVPIAYQRTTPAPPSTQTRFASLHRHGRKCWSRVVDNMGQAAGHVVLLIGGLISAGLFGRFVWNAIDMPANGIQRVGALLVVGVVLGRSSYWLPWPAGARPPPCARLPGGLRPLPAW